jgi:uncharacterized protein (DUF433 family)
MACTRLRRVNAEPLVKSGKGQVSKRKRRKGPTHPYRTPAHVKVLANIEVCKDTGCWLWLGTGTDRYGTISSKRTRTDYVHRVMYEHASQRKLKAGEVVRHTCDNGFCCNPEHLVVGTQKDNARDTIDRRRGGTQKLLPDEAKEVLIRRYEGESTIVLANEYGLTPIGIEAIGSYSFRYLSDDPDVKAAKDRSCAFQKLSREQVADIKRRVSAGESHDQIATCYNISVGFVGDIARGRRWRSVD